MNNYAKNWNRPIAEIKQLHIRVSYTMYLDYADLLRNKVWIAGMKEKIKMV